MSPATFSFFFFFFSFSGFLVIPTEPNLQSIDLSHYSCFFFAKLSSLSSSDANISHYLSVMILGYFFLSIISSRSSIFFMQTEIATSVLIFKSYSKALSCFTFSSFLVLLECAYIFRIERALQTLKCCSKAKYSSSSFKSKHLGKKLSSETSLIQTEFLSVLERPSLVVITPFF